MDGGPVVLDAAPITPRGKIGPNAVIQLGSALTDRLGRAKAVDVFSGAGLAHLLDHPPDAMIDEAIPAALYDTLWQACPDAAAEIAAEAGKRTADYVIANRIPRIARLVLNLAPQRMGTRLLLAAIRKNAWTFAGSGRCEVHVGQPSWVSITDNPLVMPDCAWHSAVFARLFDRLVARGTQVLHTACCLQGAPASRFEIMLPGT